MIPAITRSVLIATGNPAAYAAIRACLLAEYNIDHTATPAELLSMFQRKRYEFTFIDIALWTQKQGSPRDEAYFRQQLLLLRQTFPNANIVIISPLETTREAVWAVKAGASNYIAYPINPEEVRHITEVISEDARRQSELDYLRGQFWETDALDLVRTLSPLMKTVFEKVRSVAATRTTVLLTGETGTGKGLIARLIHQHSNRRDNQFISIHCGAIPDTLLESELFGHEKGAFTGAIKRKLGKFEIARGGTIFLDEIGTVSPAAQIKLLQVLQDRTFQRVGGEDIIESNARVITATNTDLIQMTERGDFRKDLFYRLNVFPIEIPRLRDRKEDIPPLVELFLKRLNTYYGKSIRSAHPTVIKAFENYAWPGNIRELENLMERAYILETTATLTPQSFPGELFADLAPLSAIQINTAQTLAEARRKGIDQIEREYLKALLKLHKGRINLSAREAGITPRQLHKLLTRHAIRKENFK